MATTKLVLDFATAEGMTTRHTFNYANAQSSLSNIQQLISAITTNNSIYAQPPVSIRSAKFVVTNETYIDIT